MNQERTQQLQFSNCLNLLDLANYEDPASRWSNADNRVPSTNPLLHVLDTIALCMATGLKGDVIGSAFFKSREEKKTILLSKNADPSSQDQEDAVTLINLMQGPGRRNKLSVLPFIARRGAEGVQKRLSKLSGLMKLYRNELLDYIKVYTVAPAGTGLFRTEFPEVGEEFFLLYRRTSAEETPSAVKQILEDIIKKCVVKQNFVNEKSSLDKFNFVVCAASTLGKSRFFRKFTSKKGAVKTGDTELSKLWRNVDKIHQYIRIDDAIHYLQQNGPFTVKRILKRDLRDVSALRSAADFEFKSLLLDDVWATIDWIKNSNTKFNTKQIINRKNVADNFQRMNKFWKKQDMEPRHATTTLHAELKLIIYLEIQAHGQQGSHVSSSTPNVKVQQPIGCSKRSCLVCTCAMDEINKLTKVTYLTAGSHTGVYATCAQIGPISKTVDPQGECGERIFQRLLKVSQEVVDKLYGPSDDSVGIKGHRNKHSEDYASASNPDGEGEHKSARRYEINP